MMEDLRDLLRQSNEFNGIEPQKVKLVLPLFRLKFFNTDKEQGGLDTTRPQSAIEFYFNQIDEGFVTIQKMPV
ncbi:MAG: hypothetical protein JETCAE03_36150 [Ignavibacteriaceae bacterium]|jgi:hypothetical protein|nr:MAG: hypothetical protein JETCAE03_36150 [Ignavibacteriaceae bacterium]